MINRLDAGLRRLVATNLIGMLFVDVSGKNLDVEESFLQTLGYNRGAPQRSLSSREFSGDERR